MKPHQHIVQLHHPPCQHQHRKKVSGGGIYFILYFCGGVGHGNMTKSSRLPAVDIDKSLLFCLLLEIFFFCEKTTCKHQSFKNLSVQPCFYQVIMSLFHQHVVDRDNRDGEAFPFAKRADLVYQIIIAKFLSEHQSTDTNFSQGSAFLHQISLSPH